MSSTEFISADTSKISDFQNKSKEVIKEFGDIKKEFNRINCDLLKTWQGAGADAYKYETENILEKIGSIENVLNAINESTVKDIREQYSKVDEELGEYNKNAGSEEGDK